MLRILCLLLLLSGPLCGQTIPDSPRINELPPIYTPPPRTAADTVQALHRMFVNRRTGGGLLLALSSIIFLVTPLASVPSSPPTSTYGHLPEFISGVRLGFIIATPVALFGGIHLAKNSKAHEALAISQYQQVHTLPRRLAKKLRPEHFLPLKSSSPYR